MNNPIARKEKLVVQEMPDEVLVYDLNTHKAHCLNKTAAFVWSHCDGKTTTNEIAKQMNAEWHTAAGEDIVWLALRQLDKVRLLQEPLVTPETRMRFSRREAMRKLGWAATMTLPLVASVIAPTAVFAASCVTQQDCTSASLTPENIAIFCNTPCGNGCDKVCRINSSGNAFQCAAAGSPSSPCP